MQPIIRHTITITITETWTITWADGQETSWQTTQAVPWLGAHAPATEQPAFIANDDGNNNLLDDAATDATVATQ